MRITLEIEDAEPGSIVTVIVDEVYHLEFDPEPDPGGEAPEEEEIPLIRAIGGKG